MTSDFSPSSLGPDGHSPRGKFRPYTGVHPDHKEIERNDGRSREQLFDEDASPRP